MTNEEVFLFQDEHIKQNIQNIGFYAGASVIFQT
jgi:hypothetical protein